MDLNKAEEMIKLMRNYGVTELKIKDGDTSIHISTAPSAQNAFAYPQAPAPSFAQVAPAPQAVQSEAPAAKPEAAPKRNGFEVKSPFVGTFYAASAPGEDPFVSVGTRVKKGDTLCIVEAMKLMNEIEAEKDGTIVEILVENEEPIEFDQPLFIIE